MFPELYSNQHEGDIFLFGEQKSDTKNAVRDPTYRWPNATVPYEISSNFSKQYSHNTNKNLFSLQIYLYERLERNYS